MRVSGHHVAVVTDHSLSTFVDHRVDQHLERVPPRGHAPRPLLLSLRHGGRMGPVVLAWMLVVVVVVVTAVLGMMMVSSTVLLLLLMLMMVVLLLVLMGAMVVVGMVVVVALLVVLMGVSVVVVVAAMMPVVVVVTLVMVVIHGSGFTPRDPYQTELREILACEPCNPD